MNRIIFHFQLALLLCILLEGRNASSQNFNDFHLGTPYSEVLTSITQIDSIYYVCGNQTDIYSTWVPSVPSMYRPLILKIDLAGNPLDTIYLDTLGYNKFILSLFNVDSFIYVVSKTNPLNDSGKVLLLKYNNNFDLLQSVVLDTLMPNASKMLLSEKYQLIDSSLYFFGQNIRYNGAYKNKPFIACINIKSMTTKWFQSLSPDFYPVNMYINEQKKEYNLFEMFGEIFVYDSLFNLIRNDTLLYPDSIFTQGYPLEDNKTIIPYRDSLFIISGISHQMTYPPYTLTSGMAIITVDSKFNELAYHFYPVDSMDQVKTSSNNSILRSIDGGFFLGGVIVDRYILFFYKGIYITKLDSNFNMLWNKKIVGDSNSIVEDMIATEDGGVIIAYSFIYTESGSTNRDSKLIKVGPNGEVTTIYDFKPLPQKQLINLNPNPTSDELIISLIDRNDKIKFIRIFDTQQRDILYKQIDLNHANIDVSNYAIGIYFIEGLTAIGQRFIGKFVKE
jgi:hypothetical protein